jgi:hypothetical protein
MVITLALVAVFICLVLALLWVTALLISNFFDAPWVPLRMNTVDRMLELANIKPGETVMDLGSGDGRLLIRAVKNHQARGVGVELNPIMAWVSRLDLGMRRMNKDIKIKRQDMCKTDISQADVIMTYLLPEANQKLEKKVMIEAKPGARVISYAFHYPNWPHSHQERAGAGKIYVYHKNW